MLDVSADCLVVWDWTEVEKVEVAARVCGYAVDVDLKGTELSLEAIIKVLVLCNDDSDVLVDTVFEDLIVDATTFEDVPVVVGPASVLCEG